MMTTFLLQPAETVVKRGGQFYGADKTKNFSDSDIAERKSSVYTFTDDVSVKKC